MKCSICENGYEDHICERCKADKVNAGWFDGEPTDAYLPMGETRRSRMPNKLVRATQAILAEPNASKSYLARQLGVSRRTVTTAAKFARRMSYLSEDIQCEQFENGKYIGALVARSWFEWQVNSKLKLAGHRPSRWFVQEELGFRLDCGPSLAWHCENLQRLNRAALHTLGTEAPKRVTYPKNFKLDPRSRRKRPLK